MMPKGSPRVIIGKEGKRKAISRQENDEEEGNQRQQETRESQRGKKKMNRSLLTWWCPSIVVVGSVVSDMIPFNSHSFIQVHDKRFSSVKLKKKISTDFDSFCPFVRFQNEIL